MPLIGSTGHIGNVGAVIEEPLAIDTDLSKGDRTRQASAASSTNSRADGRRHGNSECALRHSAGAGCGILVAGDVVTWSCRTVNEMRTGMASSTVGNCSSNPAMIDSASGC